MSDTRTLFDAEIDGLYPATRNTDFDTCRQAAALADPGSGAMRFKVLRALVEHGAMTDSEVSELIVRHLGSTAKRRLDLMRHNPPLVEFAGYTRPTPTGAPSMVWQATRAGKAAVQ